jgi:hypothetical protein
MPNATLDALKQNKGAILVSIVVLAIVGGWLAIVWQHVDVPPTMSADGKTVIYDQYTRTKDIFTLILPLLTTAVGYWLGSQGTAAAQGQASNAQKDAKEAHEDARKALSQQAAVMAVASSKVPVGEDILAEAKTKHPNFFN